MSGNPVSFRLPFESQMAKLPPEHQHIIRTTWNAITDLQGAIPLLKTQIDTNKSSITEVTNNTSTSTSSETTIITSDTIGMVNDETGLTAYTTQQSDYGAFVLLSDASAIAVTLADAPGIQIPWFTILINEGVGLVTVTPASGTISYPNNLAAGSMPLAQGQSAMIVFDSVNFTAIIFPVSPQDTPLVAHEWLDSYDNVSGAFGQSQPGFGDLSGQIDPATQMPASGVTAGTYTLATVTVDAEGLVTAASSGPTGLSVTIVTAALTVGGTQGSMTFSGGVLTSQVQAT